MSVHIPLLAMQSLLPEHGRKERDGCEEMSMQ